MNKYYNSKFPKIFKENYGQERDHYWSKLQQHIDQGFTRSNLPAFMNTFSVMIVKLLNVFDLNRDQAQFLTSACINLMFDDSL